MDLKARIGSNAHRPEKVEKGTENRRNRYIGRGAEVVGVEGHT